MSRLGLAARAAFFASLATLIAVGVVAALWPISGMPSLAGMTWTEIALLSSTITAGVTYSLFTFTVGRRLRQVEHFLAEQSEQGDVLRRMPQLGDDEVGRIAQSVNRLLARLTTARVSMIDQHRELVATQEELRLKDALAAKSQELEARLKERALLFEILRISTTETDLQAVLDNLASRLGPALRLRQLALLVHRPGGADEFEVRSVYGFDEPDALLGRRVGSGDGLAGEVVSSRDPVVVRDVSSEPEYLAFWGHAARDGSFAAIPILHRDQYLGILALTRPPDDPLLDIEMRYLGAVADQLALALRHGHLIDELRNLSTHDELTNLANRRLLRTNLKMELERSRRFKQPLSVLVIDIDHFKKLNDRCGHLTGDAALREVAVVLESNVRRVDSVARVGGEEFVVLLPRADLYEAAAVAEKLRRQTEVHDMPGGEGQPGGHLTISLGVAQLVDGDDQRSLLGRADAALYLAKRQGRNCVAVHEGPSAAGPVLAAS